MATPKKKAPPTNPLELLSGDAKALIGFLLWQNRIKNPDMAVAITAKDRTGFAEAMKYLNVEHEVRSFVRGDKVYVQLVDAKSKIVVRRQVAAKDDKGKDVMQDKDFDLEPGSPLEPGDVIVSIGNAIRPIENNVEDYSDSVHADKVRQARSSGPGTAAMVKQSALAGTFSTELVCEVCDTLTLLANEP